MTGDCGSCTVMIDVEIVKYCLVLAASASGREIITIEGLRKVEGLQKAFVEANGFQVGYCAIGIIR